MEPEIAPPGWYRDPEDATQYRWWKGTTWSDATVQDAPRQQEATTTPPGHPFAGSGGAEPQLTAGQRSSLLAGLLMLTISAGLAVADVAGCGSVLHPVGEDYFCQAALSSRMGLVLWAAILGVVVGLGGVVVFRRR